MKKIISLVLAVCLIVTTLCSVTMTASAATTVRDITVDLTKSERVGSDETNLTMSATYGDDGSMNVTFSNYAKLFMNGTAVNKTEKLWLVFLKTGNWVVRRLILSCRSELVVLKFGCDFSPQFSIKIE